MYIYRSIEKKIPLYFLLNCGYNDGDRRHPLATKSGYPHKAGVRSLPEESENVGTSKNISVCYTGLLNVHLILKYNNNYWQVQHMQSRFLFFTASVG